MKEFGEPPRTASVPSPPHLPEVRGKRVSLHRPVVLAGKEAAA
jgi:hypothetical protein